MRHTAGSKWPLQMDAGSLQCLLLCGPFTGFTTAGLGLSRCHVESTFCLPRLSLMIAVHDIVLWYTPITGSSISLSDVPSSSRGEPPVGIRGGREAVLISVLPASALQHRLYRSRCIRPAIHVDHSLAGELGRYPSTNDRSSASRSKGHSQAPNGAKVGGDTMLFDDRIRPPPTAMTASGSGM